MRRLILCSSLFGLAGCPDEVIGALEPNITVTPNPVVLGDTPFRATKTHTIQIENAGQAFLTVTGVGFLPGQAPPDLALIAPMDLPRRIEAQGALSFELNHLPRDGELDGATMLIESDDPDSPRLEVPIVHQGAGAPKIAAVPDLVMADLEADTAGGVSTTLVSVDLGIVPLGQRRMRAFAVVNIGDGNLPLTVTRVSVVDPAASPGFSVAASPDPSASAVLLPLLGQRTKNATPRGVELVVSWQPLSAGASLAAVVRVESSDPATPRLDIPVTASTMMVDPPVLRLEPAAGLDFGATGVGVAKSGSFTAHNDGQGVLILDPMTLPTNPGSVFAFAAAPAPVMINGGQSRSVTLSFTPPAAMAYQGTLRITSNDPARPSVDYPLSGAGTMMCTPTVPDPGEPQNAACATAADRGLLTLDESAQSASWNDAMLYPAMDEDWSRVRMNVLAGCNGILTGYALTAQLTAPAGEQAEVCIFLGDCASPTRMACGTGRASLTYLDVDDICNAFNNDVPAQVRVRHLSGDLMCSNYTLSFTAR